MDSYFSTGTISVQAILEASNDEMLVAAAKTGEDLAFSELWSRHSKVIFNTMYRITRNRQDAEDAVQDAFLKAYVHLKSFDGRSSFSTWLTRIAINSALMILRKKRAHPEVSMDGGSESESWQHWEVPDRRANTEEHYARTEREHHLKRAIHRLRPALRSIVEIQQKHDSSIKEIAEIAGISVAATKSRLLRARTVLRRSMA
ncbi:RNA polymerase sigma factor [Granulicella sp. S190]|uniref:RNA polymerase sigma factor n=1 Tax=Granulicella sp. S190 TaxID=1747226 RepID=UPI00131EC280|nr:sigma-70 family RNA polymerase sigma factor [Granulicella sp. S190]